ncbi:MAG: hypothetical protein RQ728_04990 [Brevefilum sp.]|nr:hypothetical protein [Brevefilum sp.]MDT8381595.1 hypothetical protein [Brevefilum sp.]MDW7754081.1 hypothetical protein [Brevefilum sp.]
MKLRKILIIIMAIMSLVWGIGFILIPKFFWSLYGIALDSQGVYMSRQLGTLFFMLGLILWLAKGDPGSIALRAIVVGLFVGNTLGFILSLIGQLSVEISPLGWVGVLSYLLLALGFGYTLLKKYA